VARWQRSGLTARAFAEQTGLNAHTLTFWKWRLGREGQQAGPALVAAKAAREARPAAFVEVVTRPGPVGDARREMAADCFEVILADGLRVRVPRSANRAEVAVVAALVTALEAR
jgi:hypothetical protein